MPLSPLFPALWSARITYFAAQFSAFLPNASRAWEGEAVIGNEVRIPTVDRSVTVRDYSRTADLALPEDVDATTQSLMIDQEKYFNFAVEDLDNRQSRIPGSQLIDLKSQGAGLAIANEIDDYVASLVDAIPNGDLLINQGAATFNLNFITTLRRELTLDGLPASQFVIVTTPELVQQVDNGIIARTYGDNVLGDRFLQTLGQDPQNVPNGFAFNLGGMAVYVSNSPRLRDRSSGSAPITRSSRGNRSIAYAYNPMDLALVQQVNQVEAYRPERRFSNAVKGLTNYGARVLAAGRFAKFTFND